MKNIKISFMFVIAIIFFYVLYSNNNETELYEDVIETNRILILFILLVISLFPIPLALKQKDSFRKLLYFADIGMIALMSATNDIFFAYIACIFVISTLGLDVFFRNVFVEEEILYDKKILDIKKRKRALRGHYDEEDEIGSSDSLDDEVEERI